MMIRKQLSSFGEVVSLPELPLNDFLSSKLTFCSSDTVISEHEEEATITSVYNHSDDEYDSLSEDECSDQVDVNQTEGKYICMYIMVPYNYNGFTDLASDDTLNDLNNSPSSSAVVTKRAVSEHRKCIIVHDQLLNLCVLYIDMYMYVKVIE